MTSPQHNKRREMDVMKLCGSRVPDDVPAPHGLHESALLRECFSEHASSRCRLMSDWKVQLVNESTKEFEVDFEGPSESALPGLPCQCIAHLRLATTTASRST